MPCFVEAVWPSSLHHPNAQQKAASEISSCLQRQWVKLIQALAALIKPHEGRKRQGSASHTQAMGIVPALLLIERWVANEAGHTSFSLETHAAQVNAYFTPSEPRSRKGEREKDREFCLGGYECGSWVPPKPPVQLAALIDCQGT